MSGKAINKYTYKNSGVNIDAGNSFVKSIADEAASTKRPGADSELGGFGALFDLKRSGFRDPILVAATDGVGTKLKVASAIGRHDTIGIDLVAMCVNDLVVQGAEPLFFLDYLAVGRLDIDVGGALVKGIAEGCRQAGCALIGGETAEMPGVYTPENYDLAGFAVGAVERHQLLTGQSVEKGDKILGLASNGLHANGFSLVREIVSQENYNYHEAAPFDSNETLGEALLTPTRIYVSSCLQLIRQDLLHGLVHITGGGLIDNIPRTVSDSLAVRLNIETWPLPPVIRWLAEVGQINFYELARTFNCGIGMIVIVPPNSVERAMKCLSDNGETVYAVGDVCEAQPGTPHVTFQGNKDAWLD